MSSSLEPLEPFKQGIKITREVLGDAYVDKALAGVSTVLPDLGNKIRNKPLSCIRGH